MKFIVGAGGMGREVAEYLSDVKTAFQFAVQDEYLLSEEVDGIRVCSLEEITEDDQIVIAVGDPKVRFKIASKLKSNSYFSVVHKASVISATAQLGSGIIVAPGVVVSAACKIGNHVILNYNCTLGHDVKLGDFVSIYPGAAISGNVQLGSRVLIGANASIREGVQLADDVTIGMGAVVLNSINEPGVYVGNPLRKID